MNYGHALLDCGATAIVLVLFFVVVTFLVAWNLVVIWPCAGLQWIKRNTGY